MGAGHGGAAERDALARPARALADPGLAGDPTYNELFRGYPFCVLEEDRHLLVTGLCGRIWTLARDYPRLDGPEASRTGTRPAPCASSSALGPRGGRRPRELVSEARVEPVDRPLGAAAARAVDGHRPLRAARRRGAARAGRAAGRGRASRRRPVLEPGERGLPAQHDAAVRAAARRACRPARWCSERSTARRSAGTGTGRMCAGPAASPSSSTDQRGVRPRSRHSPPPASARTIARRRREAHERAARAHDDRARARAGRGGGRRRTRPSRRRRAPPGPTTTRPGTRRPSSSPRRRPSPSRTTRLAAEHRLAADARAEHGGVPVLRQPGDGLGDAERAEARARPRHAAVELRLQPRVRAEVDGDPALGAAQHRRAVALPRGGAEAVGLRRRGRRVAPAHEAARMRGERDDRPRPVRRAADAAQRDDAAPAAGLGQPPVVALHRDAVRRPRVAERAVGPGPAVGARACRQRPIRACVTGMPKRSSASASAVVLAVVAVALGVGEDHDAVGLEGGQRVLDGDAGLALAGVAGGVDALLLEPLDGLLLRGVGLRDRVVGVRDPERDLGPVGGGGDDEHLGALDLLAERGAQDVGVDGLGGDDEQFHAGCATPRPGVAKRLRAPERTRRPPRRRAAARPGRRAPCARSASAIAPASRPSQLAQQLGEPLGRERLVGRARLDDAVGVEHERVAAAERDALLGDLRLAHDPQQRARRAGLLDLAVGAQDQRERVPARGQHDVAAVRRAASPTRRARCRSGSRGPGAAAPR